MYRTEVKCVHLQFMLCRLLLDAVDRKLGCVCVRWRTGVKEDHTLREGQEKKPNG